ncbi:potassium-transporting ATPase subunit C [Actinophytocola algeriensis]|uniref:Potassium-transporting ATPase KdpC subunit n=1 Tax=Actinophytocola algeriensis TaxID=1768010 RepID=A0A7W7Q7R5_9PSEU|nr:potassium-transporting ATPase subunit C [Actinophytocola algeriensis]MBB4908497.1 K+-transporting ATPase ATPase C chain [Actinophytocola algeriensis]MBE1475116.1 K+-transporting ATPase ATPase C chain [Actinophytocola algeriensis]
MNSLARQALAGLRVLVVLTVLLGILYPLGVWAVSRLPGLAANAEGSVVTENGQAVGSDLIGIDPVAEDPAHDPWFHTRPSAVARDLDGDGAPDLLGPADPSVSAGSNKGGFDADLVAAVRARKEIVAAREGVDPAEVPADAVTASASGLDPAISPAYAELQVPRVARENGLSEEQVRALVGAHTTGRGMGVLGEPGVRVLTLNLAVQAARR